VLPLKSARKVEDLNGTVTFLAAQRASFITEQLIQVDGGMTRSLA
jgi:3-oxoacyl-[acyl-carrier protein] reductase